MFDGTKVTGRFILGIEHENQVFACTQAFAGLCRELIRVQTGFDQKERGRFIPVAKAISPDIVDEHLPTFFVSLSVDSLVRKTECNAVVGSHSGPFQNAGPT